MSNTDPYKIEVKRTERYYEKGGHILSHIDQSIHDGDRKNVRSVDCNQTTMDPCVRIAGIHFPENSDRM